MSQIESGNGLIDDSCGLKFFESRARFVADNDLIGLGVSLQVLDALRKVNRGVGVFEVDSAVVAVKASKYG